MRPYTGEHIQILHPGAGWLADRAADLYTQFGEDGLIDATLEKLGVKNKCCFEVGAADGVFFSNTKRLREENWRAVLIESDDEAYGKLEKFKSSLVSTIHASIDENSLDRILYENGMPADLDLGVIDIDGQDYYAWQGMTIFRPRLMLVEFCVSDTKFIPPKGGAGQAGRDAIVALGASKGYVALAQTYVNLLFCRADQM